MRRRRESRVDRPVRAVVWVQKVLQKHRPDLGRGLVQNAKAGAAAQRAEVPVLPVGAVHVEHGQMFGTAHEAEVLGLVANHLGVRSGKAAATEAAVATEAPRRQAVALVPNCAAATSARESLNRQLARRRSGAGSERPPRPRPPRRLLHNLRSSSSDT